MDKYEPQTPEQKRMLQATMDYWEPADRPLHCSNCVFAVVTGTGESHPEVVCAKGHGAPRRLHTLIRESHPLGFCRTGSCPDFVSMSDESDFD